MGRGGGALPKACRNRTGQRGHVTVPKIEDGVPLARMTTVGIGGPARAFARPRDARRARGGARLGGARSARRCGRSGSARTCSPPTKASTRSSSGSRASSRRSRCAGDRLVAGGGAANAVCLHRARAAGLGGFEFACAIPGTAGGGVRMNAGAYGSDWKAILVRALVVDAERRPVAVRRGARSLVPALRARPRPGRRAGRVPARARARRRDQGDDRRPCRPGARRRSRRTSARSAASSRTRTTSSGRAG